MINEAKKMQQLAGLILNEAKNPEQVFKQNYQSAKTHIGYILDDVNKEYDDADKPDNMSTIANVLSDCRKKIEKIVK